MCPLTPLGDSGTISDSNTTSPVRCPAQLLWSSELVPDSHHPPGWSDRWPVTLVFVGRRYPRCYRHVHAVTDGAELCVYVVISSIPVIPVRPPTPIVRSAPSASRAWSATAGFRAKRAPDVGDEYQPDHQPHDPLPCERLGHRSESRRDHQHAAGHLSGKIPARSSRAHPDSG